MAETERIWYGRLDARNFGAESLDSFVRRQQVRRAWRRTADGWQLVPAEFWEDWSLAERREIAADIAAHMGRDQSAFGAFSDGRLVGFVTVSHRLFGVSARYAELVCFQVSEPYRGRGIGRRLFGMAVAEMEIIGAERLYISSFCAEETQAVYRALGCRPASEINAELALEEPKDVPLEYVPQSGKKI